MAEDTKFLTRLRGRGTTKWWRGRCGHIEG